MLSLPLPASHLSLHNVRSVCINYAICAYDSEWGLPQRRGPTQCAGCVQGGLALLNTAHFPSSVNLEKVLRGTAVAHEHKHSSYATRETPRMNHANKIIWMFADCFEKLDQKKPNKVVKVHMLYISVMMQCAAGICKHDLLRVIPVRASRGSLQLCKRNHQKTDQVVTNPSTTITNMKKYWLREIMKKPQKLVLLVLSFTNESVWKRSQNRKQHEQVKALLNESRFSSSDY